MNYIVRCPVESSKITKRNWYSIFSEVILGRQHSLPEGYRGCPRYLIDDIQFERLLNALQIKKWKVGGTNTADRRDQFDKADMAEPVDARDLKSLG